MSWSSRLRSRGGHPTRGGRGLKGPTILTKDGIQAMKTDRLALRRTMIQPTIEYRSAESDDDDEPEDTGF